MKNTKNIAWKSRLFLYKFFENNKKIGQFKWNIFNNSALGEINNTKIYFKNKGGFFVSKIEVVDAKTGKNIGMLGKNNKKQIEIKINNKKYQWKYDNIWNTQWSISENDKKIITYKASLTKENTVETLTDDELLFLLGFHIYSSNTALLTIIVIAVCIPVLLLSVI